MNWLVVVQLIIQEGLPLAEALVKKWQQNPSGVPTDADWQELKALSQKTPETQMLDALGRAGVDLSSDRAKELMALVQPPTPLVVPPPDASPVAETITGDPEPVAPPAPPG